MRDSASSDVSEGEDCFARSRNASTVDVSATGAFNHVLAKANKLIAKDAIDVPDPLLNAGDEPHRPSFTLETRRSNLFLLSSMKSRLHR